MNNNKFWYITEYDDCSVETHYGRVGDAGSKKDWTYGSQAEAAKDYDKRPNNTRQCNSNRNQSIQLKLHIIPIAFS